MGVDVSEGPSGVSERPSGTSARVDWALLIYVSYSLLRSFWSKIQTCSRTMQANIYKYNYNIYSQCRLSCSSSFSTSQLTHAHLLVHL